MKRFICSLLTLTFFGTVCLYGQTQNPSDSIGRSKIHKLAVQFSLSSDQETAFFILEKNQNITLDSISHLNITPETKNVILTSSLKKHDHSLRAILTADQWANYKRMLEARRQEFLNNSRQKKITVTEIKRDSL